MSNLAEAGGASWIGRQAPQSYPAPHPTQEQPSHLEVVSSRTQRRARPRPVYAIVTVGTLMAIVVTQLLLSIMVSQGAYQVSSLESAKKGLQRSYQAVSEDLHRVSSPQNLAANAEALGMVSNANPVYLRLSDGAVLGSPTPAPGDAGTLTAGAGNLVPNSLLAGVPLVTQPPAANTAATASGTTSAGESAAPRASNPANPPLPVPLNGVLPSPTTH